MTKVKRIHKKGKASTTSNNETETKIEPADNKKAKKKQPSSTQRETNIIDNNNINDKDVTNIDTYENQFSHTKPTPELLLQHESDIKITKKLFYEITGFDYNNSNKFHIDARSKDPLIRQEAINGMVDLINNYPPNIIEQDELRNQFYSDGGHHNLLLQVCSICGMRDYINVLHGEIFELNNQWINGLLRLDDNEIINYKHSRVEGYLNLKLELLWESIHLYCKQLLDI